MARSDGGSKSREAMEEPVPAVRAPARWEAIAAALRDDILQGRHVPGERLPNETELARRFAVNRLTLRQAMQSLARDGYVHVVQGSGTFVRQLVLDYALRRRTRMTENLASVGERANREWLSRTIAPAEDFAARLGVPRRHEAEWLHSRASVRGRAVSLSTGVFPRPRFDGIGDEVVRLGSITAAFKAFGVVDYTRAHSVVSARMPSEEEADALSRAATQPVLVVQYVNVDGAGQPIEAGMTVFAADAVQLTVVPEDR